MKLLSKTCMRFAVGSVAAMLLIGTAQATNTVTGSIWESDPTGAGDATPANVPLTTPNVTFTATSTPLDFQSGSLYTIGEFLNSQPGTTIFTGASQLGNTLDNTLFDFTGSVTVTTGETFTVGHDDGLTLTIGGLTVISEPLPTSFVVTSETYTGPSGTLPFQLVYGECCGAPADLEISLPLSSPPPVPEPGTFIMLGTGMLGLGGTLKRKFFSRLS
jgi:hypothetical protein